MPVYRCPNGKWKIGKRGKCRFKSKAAAERAFKHWIDTMKKQKEESESVEVGIEVLNAIDEILLDAQGCLRSR